MGGAVSTGPEVTTKSKQFVPRSLPRPSACNPHSTTSIPDVCDLTITFTEKGAGRPCTTPIRISSNAQDSGIDNFALFLQDDNREFESVVVSTPKDATGNPMPFVPNAALFQRVGNTLAKYTFIYRSVCHKLVCDFDLHRPDIHPDEYTDLAEHGEEMAQHLNTIMRFVNMDIIDIQFGQNTDDTSTVDPKEQNDTSTVDPKEQTNHVIRTAFRKEISKTQKYMHDFKTYPLTIEHVLRIMFYHEQAELSEVRLNNGGSTVTPDRIRAFWNEARDWATPRKGGEKKQKPTRIVFSLFDTTSLPTTQFILTKKIVTEMHRLGVLTPPDDSTDVKIEFQQMNVDERNRIGVEAQIKVMMASVGLVCTSIEWNAHEYDAEDADNNVTAKAAGRKK